MTLQKALPNSLSRGRSGEKVGARAKKGSIRAGRQDAAERQSTVPAGFLGTPNGRAEGGGHGSLAPMSSVRSGPQSSWGVGRLARPGRIEYRLMRESIVKEYRRGRLGRLDVCDAQPELLRVAKNLGGRPIPSARSASTNSLCTSCSRSDPGYLPVDFP